jgi:hypothetical protein
MLVCYIIPKQCRQASGSIFLYIIAHCLLFFLIVPKKISENCAGLRDIRTSLYV